MTSTPVARVALGICVALGVAASFLITTSAASVAAAPLASASPTGTCVPIPNNPVCLPGSPSPSSSSGGGTGGAFPSKISIRFSDGAFRGKVTSQTKPCDQSRSIVIKRIHNGSTRSFAKTITNHGGKYKVPAAHAHGRFFSIAKTSEATTADGSAAITCKQARSKKIST